MGTIAVFLATLLSIDLIIIGAVAGYFAYRWWHVALWAVVAAGAHELIMHQLRVTRTLDLALILIAVLAGFVWAALSFLFFRRRRRLSDSAALANRKYNS